jgi:hypothetical protein
MALSNHPEAVRARKRRKEAKTGRAVVGRAVHARVARAAGQAAAASAGQLAEEYPEMAGKAVYFDRPPAGEDLLILGSTPAGGPAGKSAATRAAGWGHPAVLAVLFLLSAGAAAGTFVMAWGTLGDMYPGVGAAVRALGLVATELIFGHLVYVLWRMGMFGAAGACLVVVLICAAADVGLASVQGTVVTRAKEDGILKDSAPVVIVGAANIPGQGAVSDISGGPKKAGAVIDYLKGRDAAAREDARQAREDAREDARQARADVKRTRDARLKLAKQRTQLEKYLPGVLALLCALAAAATTPLLEAVIHSRAQGRQGRPRR